MRKVGSENAPIIKGGVDSFLYLDTLNQSILFIYKEEQIYVEHLEVPLLKGHADELVFETTKLNYNTLNLHLHYFVGMRDPFRSVELSLQWLQIPKKESALIYIHSNIHLIITETGLCQHFRTQVKSYVEGELAEENEMANEAEEYTYYLSSYKKSSLKKDRSQVHDDQLGVELLDKLFFCSPATTNKLSEELVERNKSGPLSKRLFKCLSYLVGVINSTFEHLQ